MFLCAIAAFHRRGLAGLSHQRVDAGISGVELCGDPQFGECRLRIVGHQEQVRQSGASVSTAGLQGHELAAGGQRLREVAEDSVCHHEVLQRIGVGGIGCNKGRKLLQSLGWATALYKRYADVQAGETVRGIEFHRPRKLLVGFCLTAAVAERHAESVVDGTPLRCVDSPALHRLQ